MTYALDTNIIIHLLNGTKTARAKRDEAINKGDRIVIPKFVDYEMQRGFICNLSQGKEKSYQKFCTIFSVCEMKDDTWKRGAEIYADLWNKRLTVGDADILIAAFCMVNNYTLVTDNIKHFKVIDGLNFINWI
jgi:predicted nucleic acid-binding protein